MKPLALLGVVLLALSYVVLGFAVWRFPVLSPDGVDYASVARNLVAGAGYTLDMVPYHPGLLPTVSHAPEWHGLLRPFELAPFFRVLGVSEAWVKIPSMLYVGSTAIVLFALGRRFTSPLAGYLAALLVLSRWDVAAIAALGADDAGAAFWTLLALLCACRAVDRPSPGRVLAIGLCAAMGTLEKFTGILLPFAVVAAALAHPATRRQGRVQDCLFVLGPPTCALGLYLLRNHHVYGAFGFRFSALEWLGKESMENYFAYYAVRPTTLSVWSDLGFEGVLHGIFVELRAFFDMALETFPVMLGGPPALILLFRRQPLFALAGLLYCSLLVASICVGHQFEPRYVLSLVCVQSVAVAVIAVDAGSKALLRLKAPWVKTAGATIVLLSAGALLALSARAMLSVRDLTRSLQAPALCAGVFDFVRQHVGSKSAVLTSDPWFVVWRLSRPAVMAPTNGLPAVETVARHYGTEWALVGPRMFGAPDLGAIIDRMKETKTGLQPLLVAESEECRVYWLH